MTKNTERKTWVSRLLRDRGGNFGMMTALIFPVMLAAGGVAIDLTTMEEGRVAGRRRCGRARRGLGARQ
jgi:Flp pilus assembly protein TadG